jgi:hypothetical protein
LHAKAAFQFGDQVGVAGADLLVDVHAFAVLGYAIGQLSRSPVLGFLDLAAFFGASVLDTGDYLFDFVFRGGRTGDEDQIV